MTDLSIISKCQNTLKNAGFYIQESIYQSHYKDKIAYNFILNDKHFTSNTSNLFNLLRLSGATCFGLQRPSSGPFAHNFIFR